MSEIETSKQILEIGLQYYKDLKKHNIHFIPTDIGDFLYSFVVKFPPSGSLITPIHVLPEFDFIIVAPSGFGIIHDRFMLTTVKILNDLTRRELHINSYNPFDRDRLTFKSDSGRFLLQRIYQHEVLIILKYLERYSKCISGFTESFFPNILGIFAFRVTSKSNKIEHYLLTSFALPRDFKIHKQYELYFHDRHSLKFIKTDHKTEHDINEFTYNHPDGLMLNPNHRKNLYEILENDIEMMRVLRIYQYTLRLYVHNFNLYKREHDDDKNYIRQRSTYVSKSMYHMSSINQSNQRRSHLNPIAKESKPNSPKPSSNTTDTTSLKIISTGQSSSLRRDKSTGGGLKKKEDSKPNTYRSKNTFLFNTPLIQADYYKAKRHGAVFAYDIKGEHLAIFISFGHICSKYEKLKSVKSLIKMNVPEMCTKTMTTTASYADRFEQFLLSQVFRPLKTEINFEPWPDEIELDRDVYRDKKPTKPIEKWADIKAKLLSDSESDDLFLLSEHRILSEDTLSD